MLVVNFYFYSIFPDIPKDFKEVVLSPENDRFFAENLYADFGSVGQSLRTLVERFQEQVSYLFEL
jgi:vacuolar protein sorting-associated protein 45